MRFDYKHLAALDAVVREQSFERAARNLHISQSAVSQRITQLELQLGQRVMTRTQPMRLTPLGERLLCHTRQVSMLESELERKLSDEAEGFIVLSVGVSSDTLSWFVRTCMSWMPTEPRTLLHVYMEDESRTQSMMRNGQVLGCISQQATALPGGEVTPLGAMRFYCVATPEFAKRQFPNGLSDKALEQSPAVLVCNDDPLHFQFLQLSNPGFKAVFPFHLIPSINEFVEFIGSGAGFGLISGLLIGDKLLRGELVDLAPHIDFRLPLYWHRWAMESPLISRLTCALVANAQRLLDGGGDHRPLSSL